MSIYQFILNDFLLPVTPSKLNIKIKNKNTTVDLINGNEISLLKKPGLTDVSFKAILPMVPYSFVRTNEGYTGSISDYSQSLLSMLEEVKKDCKYIPFSVLRTVKGLMFSNINMTVSIEDYEIDEDAEKGLAMYANIKLKQYRGYSTDFLVGSIYDDGTLAVTGQQQTREGTKPIPSEYTVQPGDTLTFIIAKYYGKLSVGQMQSYINKICATNGIHDPDYITPGQKIKLISQ